MKKVTSRNKKNLKSFFGWALFCLIVMMLPACGEDIEGCLDPNASNFQADADVSCCCEYPQLKLSIKHKVGEENYSALSTYLDAIDSPYVLSSARLYLSDFELIRTNGDVVQVEDSIEITLKDTQGDIFQTDVIDDVVLIKNTSFSYDVGTINTTGTLSKIRFTVGVDLPENGALASDFEDSHPLAVGSDSLYLNQDDGYIFWKYSVITDTANNTLKDFTISGFNNVVTVELDYTTSIQRGQNLTLGLDIDYAKIFEGVSFSQDDDLSIATKVTNNTNTAFSVSE